jgi:enoyl-CoA hydratase/carnithine racemase
MTDFKSQHFLWRQEGRVGVITLNRPERKNPLTFESYAELRDLFRVLADKGNHGALADGSNQGELTQGDDIRSIVLTGAGGNFCSGGDVHEIIGPLTKMNYAGLLDFTRMTGDLVKAMRHCPQPIVAAVDGVCAGAGAILAMASDLRIGTPRTKTAFLFTRVGLAGCDMGACAILPRLIGHGRASELLFTGRSMSAEEGAAWGFFNRLVAPEAVLEESLQLARELASGPTFAHAMTKKMLHEEWDMPIDVAIDAEAEAQATCMQTEDFSRAYRAFAAKQKPQFEGD